MAIIALVFSFSIPIFQTFQIRSNLDLATDTTVQLLRRAQTLARSMEGDSDWGVYIGADSIVLFKGDDYATRDSDYDEIYAKTSNVSVSGISEEVFEKFTGDPSATGDIILSTSNPTRTSTITINSKGVVSY